MFVCGMGWLRGFGCGSYYVVLGFRMVLWFMVWCVAIINLRGVSTKLNKYTK